RLLPQRLPFLLLPQSRQSRNLRTRTDHHRKIVRPKKSLQQITLPHLREIPFSPPPAPPSLRGGHRLCRFAPASHARRRAHRSRIPRRPNLRRPRRIPHSPSPPPRSRLLRN